MLRLTQTRHQYYLQLHKDILGERGAEGWEELRDGVCRREELRDGVCRRGGRRLEGQ